MADPAEFRDVVRKMPQRPAEPDPGEALGVLGEAVRKVVMEEVERRQVGHDSDLDGFAQRIAGAISRQAAPIVEVGTPPPLPAPNVRVRVPRPATVESEVQRDKSGKINRIVQHFHYEEEEGP
jgi:hypothetical protein